MAVTFTRIAQSTTGSTTSVTVPSGTEVLVMVSVAESSSLTSAWAPTHSGGDTWTILAQRQCLAATGQDNGLGVAVITAPTAGTFTLGQSTAGAWGGSNASMAFYAVNGVDAADPIGAIGFGSRSGTATSVDFAFSDASTDPSQALVTEGNLSLVLAFLGEGNLAETHTPPSGWTFDYNADGSGTYLGVAYNTIASSGTDLGGETWAVPTGSNRAVTVQVEFKAPSGPTTISGAGSANGSSTASAVGTNATPPIVDISFEKADGTFSSLPSGTVAAAGLQVAAAYNETGTAITLPAGWTQLAAGTAQGITYLLAHRTRLAGESTAATFTNAAACEYSFYAGGASIGAVSPLNNGSSATPIMPSLTCQKQDTTSWVMGFVLMADIPSLAVYNGAPGGYTKRDDNFSSSAVCWVGDTAAAVNSASGGFFPTGSTTVGWLAWAIEIQKGVDAHSGAGSAAGSSTASAVGRAIRATAGSAAGSSTATATGRAIKLSSGSAAGSSSATAVGRAIKSAAGTAGGSSTATATGDAIPAGGSSGLAQGSSTAVAVGRAIKSAAGTAAGSSTATGVSLAVAPPDLSGARGGGGGGPASQATIDARQRHERRRRDRQDRIDATIEGRPQPKPKTAPAPSQTSSKPLLMQVGPTVLDLIAEIMAEQTPLRRIPTVLGHFDPEDDIEMLLLLD